MEEHQYDGSRSTDDSQEGLWDHSSVYRLPQGWKMYNHPDVVGQQQPSA